MIKSDPTIPAFLEVLQTNPELFSSQDLHDLDQTLDALDNQPVDVATTGIQDWYKERPQIRDEVCRRKAYYTVGFVGLPIAAFVSISPRLLIEDDRTIENRYRELRQTVKDKLKAQPLESQPIKSDSKDES